MSFAEEFGFGVRNGTNPLSASRINRFLNAHNRIDEIVEYIESSEIGELRLNEPPLDEERGRRASQAFASNPHITEISFRPSYNVAIRDLLTWFSIGGETLIHMTSLGKVIIQMDAVTSAQDYDALFALLLTSTSLQELVVFCCRYDHASVPVNLNLRRHCSLSRAAFTSLFDGVAESTLQKLTLVQGVVQFLYFDTDIESLARMIAQSSLEEVTLVYPPIWSALLRTEHVKNLDFVLSRIGNDATRLRINREWKPLLSANTPMGLWPRILEKAHAETCHGPADIIFYLLREKPDLVPPAP
jgi:hypothetical protein